jgi:hypothetical protein
MLHQTASNSMLNFIDSVALLCHASCLMNYQLFIEVAPDFFLLCSFISESTQFVSQTNQETMKLSLPSFAITALISTGNVLSTAQNYAFVDAATAKAHQPKKKEAPKPMEEQKEERTLEEMRSILRNKIKAKTELRMKTVGLGGGDGDAPPNKGQECSINESFKVREASDADVGIFGCGKDEYCVEDPASSLGGRCIKFDVEHEQDFDETLAVESHRQLQEGIPCTYRNGTKGVKCQGIYACDYFGTMKINPDNVGCGSCIGISACNTYDYRDITGCSESEYMKKYMLGTTEEDKGSQTLFYDCSPIISASASSILAYVNIGHIAW